MPRDEAKPNTSARQREVEQETPLDSPAFRAPLRTNERDPPLYGAQNRQDALWKGGNAALPPLWQQFQVLDGEPRYQDDTLGIASWNRPLPGVRLDDPGQLVPRCEWHISPLGRSYFVNHNTQTTSWTKPKPERPPGSLTPERIIEGQSKGIWSLACLGTGYNIMSASDDGSIRQWTRDGELVGRPWNGDGESVPSIAVHPDETMVVSGSVDGRLRLWNIRKGSMVGDPWEGHNAAVMCLDWSPNAQEIASGSEDGTIRRWNPNTGRQIATPIETGHGWVYAVKYSPQCDKFASGGVDSIICVWSMGGELLMEIKGHEYAVMSLCWSKDGAHIFSGSRDGIRKWGLLDGKELVVLRGHTNGVTSLCLFPDGSHLVSASYDYSVRIWDLKTNQPVGDPLLHDDELLTVAMFHDGKYIVSAGLGAKVYVWSLEAVLKQQGGDQVASDAKLKGRAAPSRDMFVTPRIPTQKANNRGLGKYGNDFWGNDTSPSAPLASSTSSLHWRSFFNSPRFSTRPASMPQSIPLEPRRWNFNPFPVGKPIRTVDVAPGRKKNRIAISPPTAAELARAELASAAQHASGNETGSSSQQGQPTTGAHGSQERPTQTHDSTDEAGDIPYIGVSCCGVVFGFRRPASHQT